MTNIHSEICEMFQKEDMKRFIKDILKNVSTIVYNEMYLYVWFICFYHVFLIFVLLANLVILLRKK